MRPVLRLTAKCGSMVRSSHMQMPTWSIHALCWIVITMSDVLCLRYGRVYLTEISCFFLSRMRRVRVHVQSSQPSSARKPGFWCSGCGFYALRFYEMVRRRHAGPKREPRRRPRPRLTFALPSRNSGRRKGHYRIFLDPSARDRHPLRGRILPQSCQVGIHQQNPQDQGAGIRHSAAYHFTESDDYHASKARELLRNR